ncbi:DNA polymerase delta subunit 4 isoform X3 [Pantherophis guttatus]|uniref:DNA polymerase delta subunit 4 isoform X3 n=1 Tax=Pantherophis guttatus TaxID=94885 RepID=A0ABM3Z627_PANGU|nr:DNA polymerase delta subunit 4 isoform X3 [Pantherophis guttatus]
MRQQLHSTRAIPGCWETSFAAGPPSPLLRSHETFRALLGPVAIREDGARRISPSLERRSGTSHGAMSRKGLITDCFQVVKKEGGGKERKEAQSPPQVLVQAESDLQDTAQPDQLEILKQFDLSWQYGPCTGITRMQRWERAKFLGLNPPTTVQDLLLKYNKDPFVIYSCFSVIGVSAL